MRYFFLVVNILGTPIVPGVLGSVEGAVTSFAAWGLTKRLIAAKMTLSSAPPMMGR